MAVYEHEQGTYRSYRVARSVDGKLRQKYFPRTRKGLSSAKQLDALWTEEQETAQQHFSGPALRWRKTEKKKPIRVTAKARKTRRSAHARRKSA